MEILSIVITMAVIFTLFVAVIFNFVDEDRLWNESHKKNKKK